jgi:ATP-dependent DNA helicase RecG
LKENPQMTFAEVGEVLGKSLSAVERASSKLTKAGLLKYVGPQKGGHWETIEDYHLNLKKCYPASKNQ